LGFGHEDRLEHVISHLVQNALDATVNRGQVDVRVFREGPHALVEIGDTGQGMSAAFVRERLFKPFETTKASGMGIGVYESAQYVRSIGGDIRVESTEHEGTTVRIFLRRGDLAAPITPSSTVFATR
jgi:signal transduction histidine kinase